MTEILALANYDVFVGNCTESLSVFMSRYSQRKVVVLTDEHTHTYCLERIRPLLPVEMLEISIPAGEVHKDLNTCQFIWGKLLEFGPFAKKNLKLEKVFLHMKHCIDILKNTIPLCSSVDRTMDF